MSNLDRREFLKVAGLGAAGVALAGKIPVSAPAAESAKRPNILFIFSDDHSLQTIGAYDTWLAPFCREQKVTPNIDRLAAEGALFRNSFCCNSLCSPSRGAILTGLHSHANGVRNLTQPVTPGVWMYPASMREAGYQTAIIGKWHLGNTPTNTDYWRLLPGQGTYWKPDFQGPDGKESVAGYTTDVLTDMGLKWLEQRDATKPFLLEVHHKAPHRPWQPPTRYYRWLADVKVPEPPTLFDDYAGRATPAHNQKMEIGRDMTLPSDLKVVKADKPAGEWARMSEADQKEWQAAFGPRNEAFEKASLQGQDLTRWKYQEYMKDYMRCIKAVDDSVGRYLDYLKKTGLDQNTIVIYASDQGFYNGEHGWFDKRWIYEESVHMPFVIRWPGVVKAGARPDAMIQNIDYAPTFMEIAGGKTPEGLHGRSFVPILRGETPVDWRKSIYYHYYDPGHGVPEQYGVRTMRHTLVFFPKTNEWELFDLEKDIKQMKSVYDDPSYAATLAETKTELTRLRTLYKDESAPPAGKAAAAGKAATDNAAADNTAAGKPAAETQAAPKRKKAGANKKP
ncbi:MAG: sulfatase-like hydrolase/transferase [Candidatus Sumerlaeota bacterium]|nr:sulfatase-like hydrolase/transferase [Candidatus Sumerlaeota bacterium]